MRVRREEVEPLVRRSPCATARCGETAVFERALPDGRLVLRRRDEPVLVEASAALREVPLEPGDVVRWHEAAAMAFERVPRPTASPFFLEDTPAETFDDIGGMDPIIDELCATFRMHLSHAGTVRRWRLRRKASVLLVGPPGTGKTMLARALANWIAAISPARRSRFMNVKPGALHSKWYGQSEADYRELFRVARGGELDRIDDGVPRQEGRAWDRTVSGSADQVPAAATRRRRPGQETDELLAEADAVIDRVLSRDSEAFNLAVRQRGGE